MRCYPSYGWCSIWGARKALVGGLRRKVGNGKKKSVFGWMLGSVALG